MNKKLIFSIAAAAALLVSTPGMNKAEAASPVEVQSKVYVHHAGQKLDQQQVNELIQKYMTNLKGNPTIQQLVNNLQKQEQVHKLEQPVKVQQPTQNRTTSSKASSTTCKEQPKTEQPAQKPVQQPVQQKPVQARSLKQQHLLLLQ